MYCACLFVTFRSSLQIFWVFNHYLQPELLYILQISGQLIPDGKKVATLHKVILLQGAGFSNLQAKVNRFAFVKSHALLPH